MLGKTLESPLDCKEIQPVHPKGDQSWVFIGRTDVEAETPVLWLPDANSWLIWEDPDVGKDWRHKEKGKTHNEMAGWHHQLDGHGFRWTPGVDVGQGGLACCGSWGHKESDTTERLNWTYSIVLFYVLVFGCKACRILAPWPEIKPTPPAVEGEVPTAGQTGNPKPPILILILMLFPPHLNYFLHWSLEPLKVFHESWNQLLPNSH